MQSWTKIGTARKDSNGKTHLVINKNIKIFAVDDESGEQVELDLGEYRSLKCFNTRDSLEGLASQGKISADKLQDRLEYVDQKRITFDIVVPPAKKLG